MRSKLVSFLPGDLVACYGADGVSRFIRAATWSPLAPAGLRFGPSHVAIISDSDRGRLWVVCKKCHNWNLSPIEHRWEAVEACERIYRGTRVRVSTENIGLATLGEGLDLVRVGKPLLPEFAAWRYGSRIKHCRERV